MSRPFNLAAAFITLITVGTASSPAAPPVAPPPPASQPARALDPARWATLLQNLASPDTALRDAAQRELSQTTWRDMGALENAVDAATDPKVKTILHARLDALGEQVAVNPPPISLELKNAPISEVADALSKALNVPLGLAEGTADQPGVTFTLSAKDQPFWEVFNALSAQHGLEIRSLSNTPLELSHSNRWRRGTIAGHLAVFPQQAQWVPASSFPSADAPDANDDILLLTCLVAFDPRLKLTSIAVPVVTDVVDDAGNILLRNPKPEVEYRPSEGRRGLVQYVFARLNTPEKKGTRIVSAKGTAFLKVLTTDEHFDIPDPESKVGQTFPFADHVFTLTRFSSQNAAGKTALNFGMWYRRPDLDVMSCFTLFFYDANGRVIDSRPFDGQAVDSISGNFTGPFKIRFSLARKTQELTFPFELKDIPLP